ncbi:MAG: TlpA disulfide reductase family protein [Verrucomicrobiota bacterium]
MKVPSLLLASFLAVAPSFAETVQEIVRQTEQIKAERLEAYLAGQPEADDYLEGLQVLANAWALTGETEKELAVRSDLFARLTAMEEASIPALIGTFEELYNALVAVGDRSQAEEVLGLMEDRFAAEENARPYFEEKRAVLAQPLVGETMEIAFTSLEGEQIDLAAMKGQVVLVDFWATWCGPCIAELPALKAAYAAYQDKGFEILGISFDLEKEKLTGLVNSEDLAWPQFFDGKGWENEFAERYAIDAIPATFLIGPDGTIVARELSGEVLEEKLAELLGES